MNAIIPTPVRSRRQLSDWVSLVRQQEMPVFDNTVRNILKISQDDQSSTAELARVVLQDASMTTRVLKLINSVNYSYYNLSGGASTISRAIVVLGFNAVRNLCLAVTLIDELVKGNARTRLLRGLAHAIHAAVQARGLALDRHDESPEEVFIAAMLHRVGELAFWCHGGAVGDALDQRLRQPGADPLAAQDEVLGFRLDQFNAELAREWSLNGLLLEAIARPVNKDPRIQTVVLGDRIAGCAESKGWTSPEMQKLIARAADLSGLAGMAARKVPEQLLQRAREASSMATEFGARQVAVHIARTLPGQADADAVARSTGRGGLSDPALAADDPGADPTAPDPAASTVMLPNGKLQLRVLRELAQLIEEGRCDFNLIMEMVLEGIYRGVGMDRVLFALITPDKRSLRAKYALGDGQAAFAAGFQFTRIPGQPHLLFQILERRISILFDPKNPGDLRNLIPPALTNLIGPVPFMLAPIVVGTQCIGLFHADRGPSGRSLDEDDFESFKHFAQQANLSLTVAASRRRAAGTGA